MINHVRTLILNDTQSDEFIPPEFVPMPASPSAARVRQWLFYGLTAEQKNARMHQLMQVLHMPEFEARVLAFDPRVTYLQPRDRLENPGSLADVLSRLHAMITEEDEHVLFQDHADLRELWHGDKLLCDLAAILLALAHHTDRNR